MTRPIDLDDDTEVEPLPDALLEAVAGGNESSCIACCSCSHCSIGPDLEPTLDTRSVA